MGRYWSEGFQTGYSGFSAPARRICSWLSSPKTACRSSNGVFETEKVGRSVNQASCVLPYRPVSGESHYFSSHNASTQRGCVDPWMSTRVLVYTRVPILVHPFSLHRHPLPMLSPILGDVISKYLRLTIVLLSAAYVTREPVSFFLWAPFSSKRSLPLFGCAQFQTD